MDAITDVIYDDTSLYKTFEFILQGKNLKASSK